MLRIGFTERPAEESWVLRGGFVAFFRHAVGEQRGRRQRLGLHPEVLVFVVEEAFGVEAVDHAAVLVVP